MEEKEWKEKVLTQKKNGYDRMPASEREAMNAYCEGYKAYLDAGKTERECVSEGIRLAQEKGFKPYVRGMALKTGDKVYMDNRGKMLMLAVIGQKSLAEGAQITAAHIDSPRMDLKPAPLYEDSELAYLKTHYYGGIRKYQWVSIPLELHGVVSLKSGKNITVAIGQGNEPKLVVNDLLPHLARKQSEKKLGEGISGEQLNLLVGSEPIEGEEKERVKLAVMKLLYEKYGFVEDDLISAELEAVPAFNATDIGLDASMIGAYGHDDRVCGASDAAAEVVAYVRRILDENNIIWQMAELGKVDEGGGGTVAGLLAKRNIDTIDAGVPVLAMHAPFEVVAKLDCYMTYKAMKTVYEN